MTPPSVKNSAGLRVPVGQEGLAGRADTGPMSWRRARELRAILGLAGRLLMLSGLLALAASIPALAPLDVVWPLLLAFTGVAIAGRLAHSKPKQGALAIDVSVMGAALLVGGVAESLHALSLLPGSLFHLTLAASLGLVGLFFITTSSERSERRAQQAFDELRLAGYIFLLAGITRAFVVGADQMHGFPAGLTMVLVALAGYLLTRTASITASTAWQR